MPAAYGALSVGVVGWALSPVFIRFLSEPFDPFTQAFVRYSCAAAALIIICGLWLPRELMAAVRQWRPLLALSVVVVGFQYLWTAACFGANPTIAQLTTKLGLLFVILLSFILFREERGVIKSAAYIVGTILSLIGVALVLARAPGSLTPQIDRYSLMLLMAAVCWAIYVVTAKHLVFGLHPVAMFTVLAVYCSAGLGLLSAFFGQPAAILGLDAQTSALLIISGLFPIAAAHPAYHFAQKHLGSAFCGSVELLNPLITFMIAIMIWPDERLNLVQWIGTAALLTGCFLVLHSRRHAALLRNAAARES